MYGCECSAPKPERTADIVLMEKGSLEILPGVSICCQYNLILTDQHSAAKTLLDISHHDPSGGRGRRIELALQARGSGWK